MKKKAHFNVDISIYGRSMSCFIGFSIEEMTKQIVSRKMQRWATPFDAVKIINKLKENPGGLSTMFEGGHMFLWVSDEVKGSEFHGLLSHEVSHIVQQIMHFVGAPLSPDSFEPYAYLDGYLTEQIYAKLA
jgi:hypothetical protein